MQNGEAKFHSQVSNHTKNLTKFLGTCSINEASNLRLTLLYTVIKTLIIAVEENVKVG